MNISKIFSTYFLLFVYSQSYAHLTDPILFVENIETSDELLGALQSPKATIIKLYSQHCPYCNIFSKTFADLAKKHTTIAFLSADGKKLNAPKIVSDFTNNTIKIPGYPSILYIKNGKIVDYQIGANPKIFEEKLQKLQK